MIRNLKLGVAIGLGLMLAAGCFGAEWPLQVSFMEGKGSVTIDKVGRVLALTVSGETIITNSSFYIAMEDGGGVLVSGSETKVVDKDGGKIITSEGEIKWSQKQDEKGFAKFKNTTSVSASGEVKVDYEFEPINEEASYKYGGIRILSVLPFNICKGQGYRARIGEEEKIGVVPLELPANVREGQGQAVFQGIVRNFKLVTPKGILVFTGNMDNLVSFDLKRTAKGVSPSLDLFDTPVYFSGIRRKDMKTAISYTLQILIGK